ncbi:MAG TPA: hypothetical protein VMR25_12505 [Planctomycetaceae bacterium]|nr:hypothetical protein [Planctomycetaceae bacterium]
MAFLRPKKLKRAKMGVRPPERRIYQTHRAWVRRHSCSVPGCQDGPIEFAHAKSRGAGGHDAQGVPLCLKHHHEQHASGIETFQRKYKVDLFALAAHFAKTTTDRALIEALRAE